MPPTVLSGVGLADLVPTLFPDNRAVRCGVFAGLDSCLEEQRRSRKASKLSDAEEILILMQSGKKGMFPATLGGLNSKLAAVIDETAKTDEGHDAP